MRPTSVVQWKQYPALWAASSIGLGILASSLAPPPATVWGVAGLFILALALWAGAAWWDRRRLVSLTRLMYGGAALLLFVAVGAGRHLTFVHPSPNSIVHLADSSQAAERPLSIVGIVDDAPSQSTDATRFTLRATHVVTAADSFAVRGRVRTTFRVPPWEAESSSNPFPTVREGDRVRVNGPLRLPRGPRNPGMFDYGAYLMHQGVCCTLQASDPTDVSILGNSRGFVGRAVVASRTYVRTQLAAHISDDAPRAVLQALLLGDRSAVSDHREEHFVRTGLMHLLAVSGLHVLLVGMVVFTLLRPLLMRFRLRWHTIEVGRALFTVAVLGLYMLLTGARPSVVRAVVMATLLIGGIVLQRSSHPLNTLGVAALILLLLRPTALFDVGFQLSMSAVAAIVTLNPRLMEGIPESWTRTEAGEWTVSMTTVSFAATLGTLPVLLFHFGRASWAGLVLNLPAIPATMLSLSAALCTVVFGGISAGAGASFGAAANVFVQGLLEIARWGAHVLGGLEMRVASPSVWTLGALVAGTIALAQWPRARARWRILVFAGVLVVAGVWQPVIEKESSLMDVVFLDVGQGDAVLVTTPDDRHILIDTGPRTRYSDAGRRIILPYLDTHGIDRLDAVIITHPDGDHLGGLSSLLKAVPVDAVYHSGWTASSQAYDVSRHRMDSLSVTNRALVAGDTLRFGSSVRAEVLSPPSNVRRHGLDNENEASVVLRLTHGNTRWLFTGDIEEAGERYLVRRYGSQLKSDVVKVAHHGSSTSSARAFVRPATGGGSLWAVICVGAQNAFGMPHSGVVHRWKNHRARVRTTQTGGVWLQSDGKDVRQIHWTSD